MARIVVLDEKNASSLNSIESSYIVSQRVHLRLSDGRVEFDVVEVEEPYRKLYKDDDIDPLEYLSNDSQEAFFALHESELIGQILLHEHWNNLASIEDIRVAEDFRGMGVGKQLIEHAKNWATDRGLGGLRLETQDINVKACLFYESCGFTLAGFDSCLYASSDEAKGETALFWYFIKKPGDVV